MRQHPLRAKLYSYNQEWMILFHLQLWKKTNNWNLYFLCALGIRLKNDGFKPHLDLNTAPTVVNSNAFVHERWESRHCRRESLACLSLCECYSHARVHVFASWCPAGRTVQPGSGEIWTVMKKHWMRSRCVDSYHRRQCWLGRLSLHKLLKQCWLVLFFFLLQTCSCYRCIL